MLASIMRTTLFLLLAIPTLATGLSAQQTIQDEPFLRPGDLLRITVWPSVELGGEFPVEESGTVSLPYLGAVNVAGTSIDDLRGQLVSGYSDAMRNPVVSVTPLFRIGIIGEVRAPGLYFIISTDNLFDVIGQAGGFTPTADQSSIRILREGGLVEIDAEEAIKTGDILPIRALMLRSGDNVIIPRSGGLQFRDWLAIIGVALSTVLVVDRIKN